MAIGDFLQDLRWRRYPLQDEDRLYISSGFELGGGDLDGDADQDHDLEANDEIVLYTKDRFIEDRLKAHGGPLWRHPRLQGIAIGVLASGLVWYGATGCGL